MKAIRHKATISSIMAKVDGSVGYRVNTPELSTEEKSAIFDLQNINVEILVSPFNEPKVETLTIKKDLDQKSPSQRLRGVLFLLWDKNHEGHPVFDTYYEVKMNKYIEFLKGKIDE